MALGENLESTTTWAVATVCAVIVAISLALERSLHYCGKYMKKKNQKSLLQALEKIKEELMILGFISLLLSAFQQMIVHVCVPESIVSKMLPCSFKKTESSSSSTVKHVLRVSGEVPGTVRRLLSGQSTATHLEYCSAKGKVPLLSLEAIHHLHLFVFAIAVVHVIYSMLTILFGGAKIRQWHRWERSIIADLSSNDKEDSKRKAIHVERHAFVQEHFLGSSFMSRVHCFFKQFYGSVTRTDYETLRLGFIMTHCKSNPRFDFHKYMMRALEDDFKVVVGISWYLWIFVIIFILLNINGWHFYFWIAFLPLILLLIIGTKLERVITRLAKDVVDKHVAVEGDLVVRPSDEHFWFDRPGIVLYLIHFILFQNAFEIAYFFWILFIYGWNSCIMDEAQFIIPRLVIGVIIQGLCSYSTLPLYAIVTQLGSSFKKAIFEEHVQTGLIEWAERAKLRRQNESSSHASSFIGRLRSHESGKSIHGINPSSSPPQLQMGSVSLQEIRVVTDGDPKSDS